jgi:MFS family permease
LFSEYAGIPKQARLLVFLSFVPNVAIGFIYTDLSYFLPNIQGLSPLNSGLIITVMGITLVAESIPLGIVSDRYGKRRMLILGNLCASLSLIGFALTSSFGLLVLVAIIEGTGEAAFAVSVVALLAEKAGDNKRTAAFSLLAFVGWVSGALGSFIISTVLALQGIGLDAKSAHIALYVAVGLVNLSITPLILKLTEGGTNRNREGILPRKSAGVIMKFSVYSMAIAFGAGLFVPVMAYWFSAAYNVSDSVSGLVLGVTNILTAGVVVMSPRLARKFGLVKATVMTQAASTFFMVLMPSAPSFGAAASIYLVRVFLMNLSNPLTQSLIMGLVTPDERGMASGLTASLWRLPNALTTVVGETLIGEGYLGLPFYAATVLYVFGITVYWFMFKNARLPEESVSVSVVQPAAQSSSVEGAAESL